jgi:hypothetical protein
VRSTEIVVWRREFITVAIERLSAILPKQYSRNSGRWNSEAETRQYLEDRVVGTSEGVFQNMKCISPTTIIVHDILHTVCLGMLQHLMDCVTSFLKQHSRIDKFNQLWVMMPPYPGFAQFKKPYSHGTQWSGKEMKALGSVIVAVFTATLFNLLASQRIPFTDALLCVKN